MAVRRHTTAREVLAANEHGTRHRIPIYRFEDIFTALGIAESSISDTAMLPSDTEHQDRLGRIIKQGRSGRWRVLLAPPSGVEAAVAALVERAPHLREFGNWVATHLRSATTIGLPASLPPVVLVGSPGIGKTWFLTRLASALGMPFRRYAMSSATLGEGLQGAHPVWRNAQPGLVAKTLLLEKAANSLMFVDEFDKVSAHNFNGDPYRPFYQLLDPSDSTRFTDEYLGFPVDASRLLWVMAANDLSLLPAPIADRLTIIPVDEPDEPHRIKIALSIYADANAQRRLFFEEEPRRDVLQRLLTDISPRAMRKAVDEAMVRASADGRRVLKADDVVASPNSVRKRYGFSR